MASQAAHAGPQYTAWSTFERPGFASTQLWDVNDSGDIVGLSGDVGFVYSNGAFTTLAGIAAATGIANDGTVVGIAVDAAGLQHGAIVSGGVLSIHDIPGATNTKFRNISANGRYVGGTVNETGPVNLEGGFVLDRLTGVVTHLPMGPGVGLLIVQGVNDLGQAVGNMQRSALLGGNASFVFDLASGAMTEYLDTADSLAPRFRDINNAGLITGQGAASQQALVGWPGNWTQPGLPDGATRSWGYGVNNFGQLVGFYVGADGLSHGLTASPVPELPITTLLLAGGALLTLRLARRQAWPGSRSRVAGLRHAACGKRQAATDLHALQAHPPRKCGGADAALRQRATFLPLQRFPPEPTADRCPRAWPSCNRTTSLGKATLT